MAVNKQAFARMNGNATTTAEIEGVKLDRQSLLADIKLALKNFNTDTVEHALKIVKKEKQIQHLTIQLKHLEDSF